jgi:ATP-dependent RNA helicase RhlE
LDVAGVSHVINFDFHDLPENYLHRIGRTGRAGQKGIAISLVTEMEIERKQKVEELMRQTIPIKETPGEVEISTEMAPHEMPIISMPNLKIKLPSREDSGPAFHEKKEKNKKVNVRKSRSDVMRAKYKNTQRRPSKRKGE